MEARDAQIHRADPARGVGLMGNRRRQCPPWHALNAEVMSERLDTDDNLDPM